MRSYSTSAHFNRACTAASSARRIIQLKRKSASRIWSPASSPALRANQIHFRQNPCDGVAHYQRIINCDHDKGIADFDFLEEFYV